MPGMNCFWFMIFSQMEASTLSCTVRMNQPSDLFDLLFSFSIFVIKSLCIWQQEIEGHVGLH
uniref:Uncharacterized protein n=1 Tax=Rhizophora mucronata TaxID=61149 RepID=A0A2P2NNN6_RHIMU